MRTSSLLLLLGNLVGISLQLKRQALQEDPVPVRFVEQVLSSTDPKDYCNPHGQIKDTCCDYQSIESIQGDVFDKIQQLVKTRFFRHYRADLWKECPFWNENALCLNRDCSVATTDESVLPVEWRKDALSAIQLPSKGAVKLSLFQPFTQCSYKDQDFCLVDDKLDSNSVVYVDLLENPERFTGYAGPSSARVWKSIYEENCFDIVHQMTEGCETCSNEQQKQNNVFEKQHPFAKVPNTKKELNQYLNDLQEESDKEEVCLEKRVYYRLISGLHSSISIHICNEWFDQETGVWGPNLDCFVNRIGAHPERLQNIYFTYALVLRSIKKIGLYLEDYEFRTGSKDEDSEIKDMVQGLVRSTDSCPSTFDERSMFKGPQAQTLKREFRDHFRNVSKIMDCVGCEKCRLWGKIQTVGLGTALKVLFSYEDNSLNHKENPNLFERGEIVALFNTFNRLSESLNAIQQFRQLYADKMSPPPPVASTDSKNNHVIDNITRLSKTVVTKLTAELKKMNIPVPTYIETLTEH